VERTDPGEALHRRQGRDRAGHQVELGGVRAARRRRPQDVQQRLPDDLDPIAAHPAILIEVDALREARHALQRAAIGQRVAALQGEVSELEQRSQRREIREPGAAPQVQSPQRLQAGQRGQIHCAPFREIQPLDRIELARLAKELQRDLEVEL